MDCGLPARRDDDAGHDDDDDVDDDDDNADDGDNDDNDDNDDNGNYLQSTMSARLGKLSQLDLMLALIMITCREQC